MSFMSCESRSSWKVAIVVLVASTFSTAMAQDIPQYSARVFYETTSIRGASFSADESQVLYTSDADGVFNAYIQPVDGGQPMQLTDSESDAVFAISYFPEDDRILFTRDDGGNELNHVYVRQLEGAERDITPGENLKASFAGWSEDLQAFYVATNERDSSYFDLYRYNAANYERERVFENTAGYGRASISRNGRWIVAPKTNNNRDTDLYVWDREHPERGPVNITPEDTDVENSLATMAPDSKSIYYSLDGAEVRVVMRLMVQHFRVDGDATAITQPRDLPVAAE